MFVLLVEVFCLQSSIFNNLSERKTCIISKLRNWMVLCCYLFETSAIFQVGLYFKKYIACLN